MKKFHKLLISLLLSLYFIPYNVLAYSSYIIPGGENIGITINSKGIMVIGKYKINGDLLNKDIKTGDIITKINDKKISTINEMTETLNTKDKFKITYVHNKKEKTTNLELIKENDTLKTGLYVKDNVTGIGTLSFIDPETKNFGALGHEITEKNTGIMLEIKNGKIYESNVTRIDKSKDGNPGAKDATINTEEIFGTINKNTTNGVFGKYIDELPNKHKYKVAKTNEIKPGKAKILTVLSNKEIKEYDINILKISITDNNKNLLFEVTDKELLNKTGGIIQGMSGSPIIQDNYIIGAVTHVVVDNPTKGYGIFITKMLEEAEKK